MTTGQLAILDEISSTELAEYCLDSEGVMERIAEGLDEKTFAQMTYDFLRSCSGIRIRNTKEDFFEILNDFFEKEFYNIQRV